MSGYAACLTGLSTIRLLLLAGLATLAMPALAQKPAPGATASEIPYNKYPTTQYGPAYADIMVVPPNQNSSPNMMTCTPPASQSFAYALCYYSGPAAATGAAGNAPLPCTLSADGTYASCMCYRITASDYPGQTYQIDINAILNLKNYKNAVQVCHHDGSGCGPTSTVNPACNAVNAGTMMPHDRIVSVFSMVKNSQYSSKPVPQSTACTTAKPYAGCMTAPCIETNQKDPDGKPLVECRCPVYQGPYEVGQANMPCDANDVPPPATGATGSATYVWSAAHTVYQTSASSRAKKSP